MSGRAVAVVAVVVVLAASAFAAATIGSRARTASIPSESGDLEGTVSDFVHRMPGPGSDGYVQPSPDQQSTMAAAAQAILDGRPQDAARIAQPLGYRVVRFLDTPTGRDLVMLQPTAGAPAWGMFVFAPDAASDLIVEVAHPYDDLDTGFVGVEMFRLAEGRGLLIAGASRFAAPGGIADMAHDSYTVFESIHEATVTAASVVVEPHGFETSGHPSGGDVVVSSGTDEPGAVARAVARSLRRSGRTVCLFEGGNCGDLGATSNVQGQAARAIGATFVHVELSLEMRRSTAARTVVARAVEAALPP